MEIIDLFSGIGGFSLAGHWSGFRTALFCERDKSCQRVLKYHFPNVPIYNDVTTLTDELKDFDYAGRYILTGGFPCQPFSAAGKRKGREDDRALFPAMVDVIRHTKPEWVVAENVGGILSIEAGEYLEYEVFAPLEDSGYEIQSLVIPASAVGAPHRRDRIWIVAKNTKRSRCVHGEHGKERTEIREQRDISSGSTDGVYIQEGTSPDSLSFGYRGEPEKTGNNHAKQKRGMAEEGGQNRDNIRGKIIGCSPITPDGEGFRLQRHWSFGFQKPSEHGEETLLSSGCENVTDPQEQRLQVRNAEPSRPEAGEAVKRHHSGADWQNFPTQSPVLHGDDGVSSGLVGISFPKWRQESIKMLGNSIVPQVAYQIFETIKEIEGL